MVFAAKFGFEQVSELLFLVFVQMREQFAVIIEPVFDPARRDLVEACEELDFDILNKTSNTLDNEKKSWKGSTSRKARQIDPRIA